MSTIYFKMNFSLFSDKPPHQSDDSKDNTIYALIALVIVLSIIIVLVAIIAGRLWYRKSKLKSANSELQNPMLPTVSVAPKTFNIDNSRYLDKLCASYPMEKGKTDRASNDYAPWVYDQKGREPMVHGHFLNT